MRIIFLGHYTLTSRSASDRDIRIATLSRELVARGHGVMVTTHTHSMATAISNYYGVRIRRLPLWRYTISSLGIYWRYNPSVAHIHGWRMASAAWALRLLRPRTTLIWTIDELPELPGWLCQLIIWQASSVADAITTSRKNVQRQLLEKHGLETRYIPDGSSTPTYRPIAAPTLGVRLGNYAVVIAESLEVKLTINDVFAATKSHKELIFTTVRETPRRLFSLLQHAAVVILAEPLHNAALLTQTMAAGKAIIALDTPLHREIAGQSGQYFVLGDHNALVATLAPTLKSRKIQQVWGSKAQRRAQRYFASNLFIAKYLELYTAEKTTALPLLDSLRPRLALDNR